MTDQADPIKAVIDPGKLATAIKNEEEFYLGGMWDQSGGGDYKHCDGWIILQAAKRYAEQAEHMIRYMIEGMP